MHPQLTEEAKKIIGANAKAAYPGIPSAQATYQIIMAEALSNPDLLKAMNLSCNEWVSDRWPEFGEEVNVLLRNGKVTSLARFKRYEEANDWWWDNQYPGTGNFHSKEMVIGWTPLPSPPTPKQP